MNNGVKQCKQCKPTTNDPVTIPTDGIEAPQAQLLGTLSNWQVLHRCIRSYGQCLLLHLRSLHATTRFLGNCPARTRPLQHITTCYKLVNGQSTSLKQQTWDSKRLEQLLQLKLGVADNKPCPNQRGLICRSQWCLSKKCISLVSETCPEAWISSLSLSSLMNDWSIMKALLVSLVLKLLPFVWLSTCFDHSFFYLALQKKRNFPSEFSESHGLVLKLGWSRSVWFQYFSKDLEKWSQWSMPKDGCHTGCVGHCASLLLRLKKPSTCFKMFQKMHRTGCFQQVRAPGAARLSKSHVENTLLNLSDLDLSCKND